MSVVVAGIKLLVNSSRPGRLALDELRLALSAPRNRDGFVSRRATVQGRRTHYRMSTRPATQATPVVLVHGLAVSHRYLMPTARALSSTYQVFVPDLQGFGLSSKPATTYDVTAHADHLARWLTALEQPPVCLVGNSFGAEVSAALAAEHPQLVAALVLVGPTSDPSARTRRGQIARFLADVVHEDKRQTPILLRDVWDAGLHRVVATLGHSVRNPIEQTLPRLRAPTLFLRGSRDKVAPPGWLAEAARLTRRSATAEITGAAHNAVTTAGTQTAAAIDAFLADMAESTTANPPVRTPN